MIKSFKGVLLEYGLSLPPLVLEFEFNPESLTRSKTASFDASSLPITDFLKPSEANRIGQAISSAAETISFEILLDATDKLNDPNHPLHNVASVVGVEPEIATLRSMLEPKVNGPAGVQIMSSLTGGKQAHEHNEHLSILLFIWGTHVLPVYMTSLNIVEQAHLPLLKPYRANATINLTVLESRNPFYQAEQVQRIATSALNLLNVPTPF